MPTVFICQYQYNFFYTDSFSIGRYSRKNLRFMICQNLSKWDFESLNWKEPTGPPNTRYTSHSIIRFLFNLISKTTTEFFVLRKYLVNLWWKNSFETSRYAKFAWNLAEKEKGQIACCTSTLGLESVLVFMQLRFHEIFMIWINKHAYYEFLKKWRSTYLMKAHELNWKRCLQK